MSQITFLHLTQQASLLCFSNNAAHQPPHDYSVSTLTASYFTILPYVTMIQSRLQFYQNLQNISLWH